MAANVHPLATMQPDMGEAARRARAEKEAQDGQAIQRKLHITAGLEPSAYRDRLLELRTRLLVEHAFKEGDFVTRKDSLGQFPLLHEGYPAVIHEVLAEPVTDDITDTQNSRFGKKYDLVIGIFYNGTFLTFYSESRLFEPWTEPKSA